MKHHRVLSLVLALCIALSLLSLLPVASAAGTATYKGTSYSTDYATWRQADPAWGPTALGDVHTMAGSGCLISSIAILMCHSGAYDPASLNPGSLRDWLDVQGYISHSSDRSKDALLSFGQITSYSPPVLFCESDLLPGLHPSDRRGYQNRRPAQGRLLCHRPGEEQRSFCPHRQNGHRRRPALRPRRRRQAPARNTTAPSAG